MSTNTIDIEKTADVSAPQAKGRRTAAKKPKPAKKAPRGPHRQTDTESLEKEGRSDRNDEGRQGRDAGRDRSGHGLAAAHRARLRQHPRQQRRGEDRIIEERRRGAHVERHVTTAYDSAGRVISATNASTGLAYATVPTSPTGGYAANGSRRTRYATVPLWQCFAGAWISVSLLFGWATNRLKQPRSTSTPICNSRRKHWRTQHHRAQCQTVSRQRTRCSPF
jgi:hypothetical protein